MARWCTKGCETKQPHAHRDRTPPARTYPTQSISPRYGTRDCRYSLCFMILPKEIMSNTPHPRTVYGIIGIGVIGMITILRWSYIRRWGENTPTETVIDNQILTSPAIPWACTSITDMMSCLIRQSSDDNLRASFVSYYRETLSTRNTLPPTQLETACQTSLSYMTKQISSLSWIYQTCIPLWK